MFEKVKGYAGALINNAKMTFESNCEELFLRKLSQPNYEKKFYGKKEDNAFVLSEVLKDRSSDIYFTDKKNTVFVPVANKIEDKKVDVIIKENKCSLDVTVVYFEIKKLIFG